MKPIAIVILVLSAALWLVQPVAAGQGSGDVAVSLRLTTSPNRADAGAEVTVSGSGAVAGLPVHLSLSPQADSAAGALATAQVMPEADGTFSLNFSLPAEVPDGVYAMRAEQFTENGAVWHYYWNVFTVGSGGEGGFLPASGAALERGWSGLYAALALLVVLLLVGQGVLAARQVAPVEVSRRD